jgi:hypothetical protein
MSARAVCAGLMFALLSAVTPLRANEARLELQPWLLPATQGAQPNLAGDDRQLWLSWIERDGKGHRMRLARYDGTRFDAPREVARGDNWFVNWADFPGVLALPDGDLATFWLARQGEGTYAYGVRVARSKNGGAHWSEAIVPHDASPTEHGFVSMWPWSRHELALAWLDGRNTGGGHGQGHDHHGSGAGAMSLRAAVFDRALSEREAWALDTRTCDCCQTDAALTDDGPVVVYRDRSESEIRDIHVVQYRDQHWSDPVPVHRDNWTVPGCPVNGPAIAAAKRRVVVAWYTAAQERPRVLVAQSHDAGAHFQQPTVLADTDALGRVDLALATRDGVWVSWLTENEAGQQLWLGLLDAELRLVAKISVHTLPRGRATGFPRMAALDDAVYLAWTDVVEGATRVVGARAQLAR